MADKCTIRNTRRRGSGARLAAVAVLSAAMAGTGATPADQFVPVHPLGTAVHLLAFPDSPGSEAFTVGSLTFDPVTALPVCVFEGACIGGAEGWSTFPANVFSAPPLVNIAGGSLDGINLATQDFVVYNSSGNVLGSVDTAGTVIQFLNDPSYAFTVTSSTGVIGAPTTPSLPATGTIYDIFNFNSPVPGIPTFTNVYQGDPSGTTKDVMVLPNGQFSISSPVPLGNGGSFNLATMLQQVFTGNMNPSAAFSNLVATSGDSSIGPDAFTINVPGFDFRLDPFTGLTANAYTAVSPLASFPPVLAAGGANAFGVSTVTQGFNIYNSGGTEVGSIDAAEGVTNFLGLTTAQEAVTSATPNLGFTAADLPKVGTVFSVTNLTPWNFGKDLDLIYIATPTGATSTLVTTSGQTTTPAFFNVNDAGAAGSATIATNPSNIFNGLAAEQASLNAHIATPTLGPTTPPGGLAFTINGITFYPEDSLLAAGYNNINLTTGGAPLLAAFGGVGAGISLGSQDFFYYNSNAPGATDDGGVDNTMSIVDFLFLQNAAFTITGCATLICTDAPATGTVFDVLELLPGVYNLYEGTPSGTIWDEIVTPLGPLFYTKLLLPASMDAGVPFTPADIVPAGLDVPLA